MNGGIRVTHDELMKKATHRYRWIWNRNRKPLDALLEVIKKAKPRAYKNEIDQMYVQGWNAAMNKVIKTIERELQ